ncbi:MAG: S46 family peptidase [Myxococcales bacterium]|nr:S46 family peptidase [Myxococcales bacterium]
MKRALVWALGVLFSASAAADEGMWLLNDFPATLVKKRYNFLPDQKWLDHVRLSSVRLAQGCSGSFVSPDGLILTNHHCAHSCVEQLSSAEKDFVRDGFYAATLAEEKKCPELEANVLEEIRDVTKRVLDAGGKKSGAAWNDATRAEIARIEKECAAGTEVRCDVVTLYNGGRYHLYRYRRYQDLRLVFVPEFAIAFFGGDPDNFTYPRYDLDMAFVRAYHNGQPAKVEHFLRWSEAGAAEGELTFVTGHPGATQRRLTVAELEVQRDVALPLVLHYLLELRGVLSQFNRSSEEHKRISTANLFYVENGVKARRGMWQALLEPGFLSQKIAAEEKLRQAIRRRPALAHRVGRAFEEIAASQKTLRAFLPRAMFLEYDPKVPLLRGLGTREDLLRIALHLVRLADEREKPNEERLSEYSDANLPALEQEVLVAAPFYDDMQEVLLAYSLSKLREALGPDDPAVKAILGAESPEELARRAIRETKLKDLAFRRALFAGGRAALAECRDPLIELARRIDGPGREARKQIWERVVAPVRRASEAIAAARFALEGTAAYPDATFTLRISYGAVQGYREFERDIRPHTDFRGAFARHTGREPYALPASWLAAKERLELDTPFNFCTTNDIIGGNSGSPVINQNAEMVGLVFDGNLQSLGGDFYYDGSQNRTVAVSSRGMLHALERIYRAERILKEIAPKK